jgi:hypothetical protein
MHPAIRAIPTFGTCSECYHGLAGHKPSKRENIPASWAARMIGTSGIALIVGCYEAEEG